MRPLSGRSRGSSPLLLVPLLLLLTSTVSAGPQQRRELDDRDLADVLANVGSLEGNITQSIASIIQDVTSLVQTFVAAVKQVQNASTENDLVGLLGMAMQGAVDDSNATPNGTVSAVGANITCPGMAVLFARGTREPGNVGLFTGPSFITALRNYVNGTTSLAIQGVDYPASIPGFLAGGSPDGSFVMAALANKTAAACPNTKLVLAGYSQGAQLVHNAMQLIAPGGVAAPPPASPATTTNTNPPTTPNGIGPAPAPAAPAPAAPAAPGIGGDDKDDDKRDKRDKDDKDDKDDNDDNDDDKKARKPPHNLVAQTFNTAAVLATVSSVVLFGDPRNGTAVPGIDAARVRTFCHAADAICAGDDTVTLDHLTYNRDAPAAALFVMQKTALGVASGDAADQGMGNVPSVPVMEGMDGGMKVGGSGGLFKRWMVV